MVLIRLCSNDPQAWGLWPALETRVRAFCETEMPEIPADALITHLRQLFVGSPDALGTWLVLHDGVPVGHVVGWLDVYWGQPYLLIQQASLDHSATGQIDPEQVLAELRTWASQINATQIASGRPERVTHLQWLTTRTNAWQRWLGGRPLQRVTVLSMRLTEED